MSSKLNRAIRIFNRWVTNPLAMTFAGRGHSPYAVVRHVGRRTLRSHATPVVASPTCDGFLIPLPYGTDVDWCRNVLAAGGCVLRRNGVDHELVAIEFTDGERAADELPGAFHRLLGLGGRPMCYLRLNHRDAAVRTLRHAELPAAGAVAFDAGGAHFLVADVDGDVLAFAVSGPAARDLDRAAIAEGRVRCPRHGWPIDPEVGRCGAADMCRYDRVRVEVEGDEIRVFAPPAERGAVRV